MDHERLIHALFDQTPEPIWVYDPTAARAVEQAALDAGRPERVRELLPALRLALAEGRAALADLELAALAV